MFCQYSDLIMMEKIIGFVEKDQLCENQGKVHKIKSLDLPGEVDQVIERYVPIMRQRRWELCRSFCFTEKR
jgi:D-3-phosphoglycerate dehydrogenase